MGPWGRAGRGVGVSSVSVWVRGQVGLDVQLTYSEKVLWRTERRGERAEAGEDAAAV